MDCKKQVKNDFIFSCHHSVCSSCLSRIIFTNYLAELEKKDTIKVECKCSGILQLSLKDICQMVMSDLHYPLPKKAFKSCQMHQGMIKDLYCLDCKDSICSYCGLKLRNSNHYGHHYQLETDYIQELKSRIPSIETLHLNYLEQIFEDDFNQFFIFNKKKFDELLQMIQQMKKEYMKEMKDQFDRQKLLIQAIKLLYTKFYSDVKNSTENKEIFFLKMLSEINIKFPSLRCLFNQTDFENETNQLIHRINLMMTNKPSFSVKITSFDNLNDFNWDNLRKIWINISPDRIDSFNEIDKTMLNEIFTQKFNCEELRLYEIFYQMEKYEDCSKIIERNIPIDDKDKASLLNSLGFEFHNQGLYDRAFQYHQEALKIRQATLGEKHPDTATSYYNIALVYYYHKQYDKALDYLLKALQIRLETLGEYHADTASSYNYIGLVYFNQSQHENALDYYQKALKITLKGVNHIESCFGIGAIYDIKGEYDKALEYYERAMIAAEDFCGKNHRMVTQIKKKILLLSNESS